MIEMAIRPETIHLSIWIGYIDDIDQALARPGMAKRPTRSCR